MCGITGLLPVRGAQGAHNVAAVQNMTQQLLSRGPDDGGVWHCSRSGATLGHRRLAVVDLSPLGHQPMASNCDRLHIAFNGEIYNHLELRKDLPGVAWRGHSDTETLLAALAAWGTERTLQRLVGMFAFAVWDRQRQVLSLARDRMGEKPLYWGHVLGGDLVFASELKALCAHPRWSGEINRQALALLMRHNAIAAPYSIYKDIHKLRPGQWLEARAAGEIQLHQYWDLAQVAATQRAAAEAAPVQTDEQAVGELEQLLGQAVQGQMQADVALGAFLSGGVDSSAVVALMCRHASRPVKTYSIGFDDPDFNEAEHARAVAKHLGTEHTELIVGAAQALAVIPQLPALYDEPFSDSSQIPTFLVCQMARQHVTVALSGDGGDELFAGYTRYQMAQRLWRHLARVPAPLRRGLARALLAVPVAQWDATAGALLRSVGRSIPAFGDRLHKFAANVLPAADVGQMYRSLVSHWHEPAKLVLDSTEPPTVLTDGAVQNTFGDAVDRMCLSDQLSYLPDDILVKVDRAAMGVSLETRVPFLDHRIVEFSWRLARHHKLRGDSAKWVLRELLYKHVPRALIERPKQGFAIPLASWLRGPLRDWAQDLLDPAQLRAQGFFDEAKVSALWADHQRGSKNGQYPLWDVLTFQVWKRSAQALRTTETTLVKNAQTRHATQAVIA